MGNVIKKFDKDTNAEVGAVTLTGGSNPSTFAYDTETGHLWVACASSDTLHVIDPVTLEELNVYNLVSGSYPYDMVFAFGYLWVVCLGLSCVTKIDPATGSSVVSITVGDDPSSIVFDGFNLWVANSYSSNVSRIDPVAGAVSAVIAMPKNVTSLVYDRRRFVWAVSVDQEVYVIDRTQLSVKTTIVTGVAPKYLEYDGDFIRATVAGAANKLSKLSLVTETEVSNIAFTAAPNDVIFDGLYIWVQLPDENRIAKINKATDTIVAYAPVTGLGTLKRQGKQGAIRFHEWEHVADLPSAEGLYNAGAVVDGGIMYVLGGYHSTDSHKTYMLNLTTKVWDDTGITDLPIQLKMVACAWITGGYLFVYGYDQSTNVPRMYRLLLSNLTGAWEDIAATIPFVYQKAPLHGGVYWSAPFLYQVGYQGDTPSGTGAGCFRFDFTDVNNVTRVTLPTYPSGQAYYSHSVAVGGQYLYKLGGTYYGSNPVGINIYERLNLNDLVTWETYTIPAQTGCKYPDTNYIPMSSGVISYKNHVYVVGGDFYHNYAPSGTYIAMGERTFRFATNATFPITFKYDIPHVPMSFNQTTLTIHEGYLYAVGGYKAVMAPNYYMSNKIFRLYLENFSQ